MSANVLFAHVPVDEVRISNGPGPIQWIKIAAHLATKKPSNVELIFTLSTLASGKTFLRGLKLTKLYVDTYDFGDTETEVGFDAIFGDTEISGWYNPAKRNGRFWCS